MFDMRACHCNTLKLPDLLYFFMPGDTVGNTTYYAKANKELVYRLQCSALLIRVVVYELGIRTD